MTAQEMAEAVREGRTTAVEILEAHFQRIRAADGEVKAFLSLEEEDARLAAEAIDHRVAQGQTVGRLAGVPVAVKDNICIRGKPTTCASRMLEPYKPPYDAHVIERLRGEDAVILGKTNLDEFAMGSSTENSGRGATRNPWDTSRAPGGSSGGSAAAVAAGFAPLALGSDTGGSIRQPASFCGVVGFKPTYGNVSRYGLVAFGSSLDQIGPFARNVGDAALLMDVIAGHDPRDATSSDRPQPEYAASLGGDRPLRVGILKEHFGDGLDTQVEQVVRTVAKALEDEGAEIREVSLPHAKYAVPIYYIIATAEASSNLARYDGVHYGHSVDDASEIPDLFSRTREEGFGDEVKRRVMLGTYVLSAGYFDAYYLRALKVRTKTAEDFEEAFGEVDVLLSPTSPTPAFALGEKTADPLAMYLSDVFTIGANLAGIPAVSVPGGETNGLPVGVQLMGRRFDDARVLAAARRVEALTGFADRIAPVSART
jgi:aspartyl-tRNA(Asn)/glutamyl-tRNA(Gln) amidotransferase subunit A